MTAEDKPGTPQADPELKGSDWEEQLNADLDQCEAQANQDFKAWLTERRTQAEVLVNSETSWKRVEGDIPPVQPSLKSNLPVKRRFTPKHRNPLAELPS